MAGIHEGEDRCWSIYLTVTKYRAIMNHVKSRIKTRLLTAEKLTYPLEEIKVYNYIRGKKEQMSEKCWQSAIKIEEILFSGQKGLGEDRF